MAKSFLTKEDPEEKYEALITQAAVRGVLLVVKGKTDGSDLGAVGLYEVDEGLRWLKVQDVLLKQKEIKDAFEMQD